MEIILKNTKRKRLIIKFQLYIIITIKVLFKFYFSYTLIPSLVVHHYQVNQYRPNSILLIDQPILYFGQLSK